MFTVERLPAAVSQVNSAAYLATSQAHSCFGTFTLPIARKDIFSVNLFLAPPASMPAPSRSVIRRMAASACNSTAKRFLARRSHGWKKSLPPSSCEAAFRAAPSAVLRRTNRTRASWLCSRSSATSRRKHFRLSRKLPAISAHLRAAQLCMKLCAVLPNTRVASAAQFLLLRLVPACSSAAPGSLLTKAEIEDRKWKCEKTKLETRQLRTESGNLVKVRAAREL